MWAELRECDFNGSRMKKTIFVEAKIKCKIRQCPLGHSLSKASEPRGQLLGNMVTLNLLDPSAYFLPFCKTPAE